MARKNIVFLSTPSARRATNCVMGYITIFTISIHALREEGDRGMRRGSPGLRNFYPRPPRGGRRRGQQARGVTKVFLSTPSARRATRRRARRNGVGAISIHALREEGDSNTSYQRAMADMISIHALREEGDAIIVSVGLILSNFYPRPPRGGRRLVGTDDCESHDISIHALREEGDFVLCDRFSSFLRFLSTPSARRATSTLAGVVTLASHFYPRPPRGGRRGRSPRPTNHRKISIHALREEGDSIQIWDCQKGVNFYPRPPRGGRRPVPPPHQPPKDFYPRPPRGGRRSTRV